MARDPVDEPQLWTPSTSQIKYVVEKLKLPSSIKISALPQGADIYSGDNIPPDTLILAPQHLRFLSFPLHPAIVLMWRILGLHPMQLNPNSYLLLSAFLSMGCRWGVSLGLTDFFYVHNCLKIPKLRRYFNFTPYRNQKCIEGKPSNYAGWKSNALMLSGEWLPDELQLVPPQRFGDELDFKPSHYNISLEPERLKWLKSHIIGHSWPAMQFASPEDLENMSVNRTAKLFDRYREPIGLDFFGEKLAVRVIEIEGYFYRSTHCERLFAVSLKEKPCYEELESVSRDEELEEEGSETESEVAKGTSEEEFLEVREMNVRDFTSRQPPSRKTKKQKLEKPTSSSGNVAGSSQAVQKQLTNSPLEVQASAKEMPRGNIPHTSIFSMSSHPASAVSPAADTSMPPPPPPKALTMSFRKGDNSFVIEDEPLLSNESAATAVVRGLAVRKPDFDVLTKKSTAELFKSACSSQLEGLLATHALMIGLHESNVKLQMDLDEAKLRIEQKDRLLGADREELELKAKRIEKMSLELSQTRSDLEKVKLEKDAEYAKAKLKIEAASAQYFRLGWNQALTDEEDRRYESPDVVDEFFGCVGMSYSPIKGMMPGDLPSAEGSAQVEPDSRGMEEVSSADKSEVDATGAASDAAANEDTPLESRDGVEA